MSRRPLLYRAALAIVVAVAAIFFLGQPLAWRSRAFRQWYMSETVTEDRIAISLGGAEVIEILRHPDKVEAVLLEKPGSFGSGRPADYRERAESANVPLDIAKRIADILTTEHRQHTAPKGCQPTYGVRLRYIAGDERVDIYLCFECATLQVLQNDQSVGWMNFDLIWTDIMHDVRRVFPNDPGLAVLEKERLAKE
jgi:hypothetical protein